MSTQNITRNIETPTLNAMPDDVEDGLNEVPGNPMIMCCRLRCRQEVGWGGKADN